MKHQDDFLDPKEQREVFFRLMAYIKGHKGLVILSFIFLLLGTGAELVGPILIQIFIDDYLTPQNFPFEPLLWLGAAYIILHVTSVIFNFFQRFWFQKIALRIIQQLRIDVFSKTQKFGLSFFDRTPAGGIISRVTNDTEAVKDMFVDVLSTFVQNIVFLIGVFIAMFYLNARLAILCLFLLPVIFGLMYVYRRLSARFYGAMSGKLSQLNGKINESIQGMTIIQAFRQQKRMRREFEQVNEEHHRAWLKGMKLDGLLLRPAVDFISILALILVLQYFGFASFQGPVEIGVLYAFVNYLDRFFEPVNQMMQRLSLFQQAIVSAGRVFRLIDHNETAPFKIGKDRPTIREGEVRFENVSFSYDGKTDVLKNISFTVRKGETLALVGHTGSGKSSIINLLMRFYPVERGRILIDGADLSSYENSELREHLGLVLQDNFLFTGDVKTNIRLYDKALTDQDIEKAARFVNADKFISRLPKGYNHPVGERGATFSSGERQLISFARTMARSPKILILDEATANVDTETEEAIQTALQRMKKGRTTLAIAHRLSTIKEADHILVLHQGEIAEEGTHDQLLKRKGLYYNMYLLQQGINKEMPG
ncbi:ABC transporter ATP-binding protein [Bacillus sp. FJAT-44742]|uniref:ABC transporter ATP-binding protein n=1 Tax=Bacillus sp. FJAT-44742 TaxID=2014005 RepID=UPI000C242657|nr:ABC transporter ATP-binding protein [Bacillus sp. FJAT-44742]